MCARMKKRSNIPLFLPEVIIFNILVWLRADILHNVMRFVCQSWYNIIRDPNFINEHLRRSSFGLLVKGNVSSHRGFFLELLKGTNSKVVRRNVNYPFRKEYLSSCDGLLLFFDSCEMELYVVNPITKHRVILTPLPPPPKFAPGYPSALTRALSGGYKVVHVYASLAKKIIYPLILTVGVDKTWREINIQHLSDGARLLMWEEPISIPGFIFWHNYKTCCLLAMDIGDEMVYEVLIPEDCQGQRFDSIWRIKSENSLILGITKGPWRTQFEFWELMEPKLGKWRCIFEFNMECHMKALQTVFCNRRFEDHMLETTTRYSSPYRGYENVQPLAVLKDWDLVIFTSVSPTGIYIFYNVKTGIFFSYRSRGYPRGIFDIHVNSLVALKS